MAKPKRTAETQAPLEGGVPHKKPPCQGCGQPATQKTPVILIDGIRHRGRWCEACKCAWRGCHMAGTVQYDPDPRLFCSWHIECRNAPSDASRFEIFSHWLSRFRAQYGKSPIYTRSPWILLKELEMWAMVGGT